MTLNGIDVGRAAANSTKTVQAPMSRKVMGDGTVRVRRKGPTITLIQYQIKRASKDQADLIVALLDLVSVWGATALTLVDDYGTTHQVRYWDSKIAQDERLGRLFTISMVFKKDS